MQSPATIVRSILLETYGDSAYLTPLTNEVTNLVLVGRDVDEELAYEVGLLVWDWMSGGDTAFAVAQEIVAALSRGDVREN